MAHIKKRGKKWLARVSQRSADGLKQTSKTFKTKAEAESWAKVMELSLESGDNPMGANTPFVSYFRTWYETYKKHTISDKTKRNYELSIKIAEQYFENLLLKDLSEERYQQFINWYAFGMKDEIGNYIDKPHNKETVDKVNIHCRACLKKAVKKGYIRFNPAEDVRSVGTITNRKDMLYALSEKQIIEFQKAFLTTYDKDNPNIPDLFNIVSLAYGPRFSENSGLTWDCVNWKGKITINKTWDHKKKDFSVTKNTASNRTIQLDKFTLKLLLQLKEWQMKHGIYHKNLVFIDHRRTPYSNATINISVRKLLALAKIDNDKFTHHNLRHTHITWLLYNKKNLKYVSRRAGHENVLTTMETYNHVLDEIEQLEDKELNSLSESLYQQALS